MAAKVGNSPPALIDDVPIGNAANAAQALLALKLKADPPPNVLNELVIMHDAQPKRFPLRKSSPNRVGVTSEQSRGPYKQKTLWLQRFHGSPNGIRTS